MKNVLIVEDDKGCMEAYKFYLLQIIGGEFNISEAYSEKETEKNHLEKRFDYAILDGLGGKCFGLYQKINANKKIIITGNENILKRCKLKNIEAYSKPIGLNEFNRILK